MDDRIDLTLDRDFKKPDTTKSDKYLFKSYDFTIEVNTSSTIFEEYAEETVEDIDYAFSGIYNCPVCGRIKSREEEFYTNLNHALFDDNDYMCMACKKKDFKDIRYIKDDFKNLFPRENIKSDLSVFRDITLNNQFMGTNQANELSHLVALFDII